MPKKFKGENSKAAEARAKKAALKHEQDERKKQQEEDELWKDEDKHVMRKQQRKEEKEKRRLEQLERKKELHELHDEEMSSLKGKSHLAQGPTDKVTRAQIAGHQAMEAAARENDKKKTEAPDFELPIVENVNRLESDGLEARTVDDAISALSMKDPELEKHPEKRMKAAYQKYEEDNLPRLKRENPNMRLSQLKQMLKKDWMKSPENPFNQLSRAYNERK